MQNRRDHVHAYQFATGRMASALVSGDPGTGESPMRRAGLGLVFGTLAAVLLSGGFAVYGLLNPGGNTSWRQPGSIIVEKETGTRYLYLGGVLRPTANYASAMLASQGKGKLRNVSRNSLAGVPMGRQVGILGAPDALPPREKLLSGPWTQCLTPDGDGGRTVHFGTVRGLVPPPADRWMLLQGPKDRQYVLWRGTKFPVRDRAASVALGLDDREPAVAPRPWLDALPDGPALAPARIEDAGAKGPAVAGRESRVGQVFETAAEGTGRSRHYVLRNDGLAPITRTEFALFAARPDQAAPRQVGPADIAAAPAASDRSLLRRLPDLLSGRALPPDGAALCLRQRADANGTVRSTVILKAGPAAPDGKAPVPTGHGMLVTALPFPKGFDKPRRYLITDLGVKYPLVDDQAIGALGYGDTATVPVPHTVLELLPSGPALSVGRAVSPLPAGTSTRGGR